jgi:O-acetyl-ADP-ribose deacetylase (regulator of RNase III)
LINIINGDITKSIDDVVVNAANKTLLGGGGVDAAIQFAAGDKLLVFCALNAKKLNNFEIFESPSFDMKCGKIWHVVGPIFSESKKPFDELANTYFTIMEKAAADKVKSISIPAISTGAYGFPPDRSKDIAMSICFEYDIEVNLYFL